MLIHHLKTYSFAPVLAALITASCSSRSSKSLAEVNQPRAKRSLLASCLLETPIGSQAFQSIFTTVETRGSSTKYFVELQSNTSKPILFAYAPEDIKAREGQEKEKILFVKKRGNSMNTLEITLLTGKLKTPAAIKSITHTSNDISLSFDQNCSLFQQAPVSSPAE